jgi:radical SAM family uncharacterized protein/radical SAM-linked protein
MKYSNVIREKLEQVLKQVAKPARYVDGELHAVKKPPELSSIKVCLAFPDVYDIGQSYLGFHILYHILNSCPETSCERTFAPWTDMEKIMREQDIPLYSLESFLPVSSFDVVGFTFQYELHYTTILNMLDLAGIPLKALERDERWPFIIGGGPCCSNPEPMAEFFDAFFLGDGEEGFPEILSVIGKCRKEGIPKNRMLDELSRISGMYIPSFYRTVKGENGEFLGVKPSQGAPIPVHSRIVKELKPEYYPDRPLVPLTEVVHDRLAVEIMRGCARGCRFCGAGMTYRPQRIRPINDVVNQVITGIQATGWEEVSLVSLSSSDYPGLDEVVNQIGAKLSGKAVSISLSSLRADNFSLAIANNAAGGRKTGLTFAVEAGTQRLRDAINKNLTGEQLFETLKSALEGGWTGFKLYFMIGLPTETDEDVAAIAVLLNRLDPLLRQYRIRNINVTVSLFSPKPMTPFQWEDQNSISELSRKMRLIKSLLTAKSIVLKETNPEVSILENLLGRGTRETSSVILDAWKMGSRLDGWSEHFNGTIWREAFSRAGISLEEGGGGYIPGSPLPWGHLHFGVDEKFLLSQLEAAYRGETTPDCSSVCQNCGPYAPFCSHVKKDIKAVSSLPASEKKVADTRFGRKKKTIAPVKVFSPVISGTRFRMKYSKKGPIRFIGHLDLVRIFDRVMRRAGIPIGYSQGFHPHPKISFGPPLSLGMSSTAEYVDFSLSEQFEDIGKILSKGMPEGMEVLSIRPISEKADSLTKIITLAEYRVNCVMSEKILRNISDLLGRDHIIYERATKNGIKEVDIRPGFADIVISGDGSGFSMTLSMETGKSVKPAEILDLILCGDQPLSVTRTEQYAEQQGKRVNPLEIVR